MNQVKNSHFVLNPDFKVDLSMQQPRIAELVAYT